MTSATYSGLRENLAQIWDQVEDTQQPVIVKRRGHQDMVILPADELESLRETAYLLRSPANAARLLAALTRGREGKGRPQDLAALRAELGLLDDSGR